MDPVTIYAITIVWNVSSGAAPSLHIEKLPSQWTIEDCNKHHVQKLAGKPHTVARCVSSSVMVVTPKRYLISIDSKTRAVDLTRWKDTLSACLDLVARFANQVSAFCVETRRLETKSKPRHG